jgi:hypothetical protein
MLLPIALSQAIEGAQKALRSDPKGTLLPYHREAIYKAIDLVSASRATNVRGWLAVITAEYVQSIWQQEMPQNALPAQLIDTSKRLLRGEIKSELASIQIDHAWEELEDLGSTPADMRIGSRPFYAGAAAAQALTETLGFRPFDYLDIDNNTSNSDLDQGTTDAAWYASIAYAGRENWEPFAALEKGPAPTPEKRKEFWDWWLLEAAPRAWQAAQE